MTAISQPWSIARSLSCSSRATVGLGSIVLLGGLVAVLVISWNCTLFYPLGADQSFFRWITEMTLDGQREAVDIHVRFTPSMVAIHSAAIALFGRSALGFRLFDGCWQTLTLLTLASLAYRETRRWRAGLLAALLYALAYYGMRYTVVGTRDAFAVLPILLMLHALASTSTGHDRQRWSTALLAPCIAGVLGFLVYLIKLPLGGVFGMLWLWLLADTWSQRKRGVRATIPLAGCSAGFVLSAALTTAALIAVGWWPDWRPLVTTYHPPGYTTGPWMMLDLVPTVLATLAVFTVGVLMLIAARWHSQSAGPRRTEGANAPSLATRLRSSGLADFVPMMVLGAALIALYATLAAWPAWQASVRKLLGIYLPAAGALVAASWQARSRIWRMVTLATMGALGSVFLQGKFWDYHYLPLLALCSYVAATELTERVATLRIRSSAVRGWTVVCLAAMAWMAAQHWWPTVRANAGGPHLLADDASLVHHYDRVSAYHDQVPRYATVVAAARRIRRLTHEREPIQCLFSDPRPYQLAHRPAAHHMVFTGCEGFNVWYPELMQALHTQRPKVVLARIPKANRQEVDLDRIERAVFADLEQSFGPPARTLREDYHLVEIIDDVVILQPREATLLNPSQQASARRCW